jgi:gluconokinase
MASGTGLWSEAGWDAELLAALGIDEARLPPVSDEPVAGWYPPLGDGACSNVGAGCTTPDRAALMIGTSGALRVVTTGSPAPPPGLFRYRLDAERAVVGGALSAGGNLHAWLVRTLRIGDTHGLADRPAAAHGLTFVPSLGGERSPTWDAYARGAIHGLSFETTVADVAQAALEAVAYRFAAVAEQLPDVREVVATGAALVRNDDWAQILADVLEQPVVRSGEGEASARGAAMAVRERLGLAVPAARLGRTFEPRPARFAAHREARGRLEQASPERAMDIPS